MNRLAGARLDWSFVIRSLVVAGIAAAARSFFVAFAPFWAGDSSDYHAIAVNVASGNGYGLTASSPTVFRPPTYPLVIAAVYAVTGPFPGMVLALQVGLGALASWVVYLIGRQTVGERAGFCGAVLAGVYPHLAFYAATLLSETVSHLLLSVAILAATTAFRGERIRGGPLALAGVSLALATLSSPRLIGMPFVVVLALALRRVGARRIAGGAALLLFSYAATLAPWTIRNVREFGAPVSATVGVAGLTVWLSAYRTQPYDYRVHLYAETEPAVARWIELYYGTAPSRERELLPARMALEDELMRDSLRLIAADPIAFIGHRVRIYPSLWIQPAIYAGHFRAPLASMNDGLGEMLAAGRWPAAALRVISILIFTVGLFAGAVVGAWLLRRRLGQLATLWVPALYAGLTHSVLLAEQRYSILAHPYLWLFAGAAIAILSRREPNEPPMQV